ncbi:hypothetical protein KGMB02408_10180 [Bacteroides faecalis]|uniref:Uncharacterized protein n=1 Tax=Bacteroides faecalis TaxID=2447885 RepID=A0A401LRJ5_9BACE|nr:hypothetical protein KGMB02408_10180 [Bacteroides faecalis]
MKKNLIFIDKIILPLYCVVICIALCYDYAFIFPGYQIIRDISILLGIFPIGIGNIINLFYIKHLINKQGKKLKEILFLNSYIIIETLFKWYFFFYVICELYTYSNLYTYLILLIGGIYYGVKIANHKLLT